MSKNNVCLADALESHSLKIERTYSNIGCGFANRLPDELALPVILVVAMREFRNNERHGV